VKDCSQRGFGAGGETLYAGPLGGAAFGNRAYGAQEGDRTLNPGDAEVLCVRVNLPLASPNVLQRSTATAKFTFFAEQTGSS